MEKKIHMVDLKGQYEKIKPEVDHAIQNVIDNTAFINGEDVKLFQQELSAYLDGSQVITCANGTDALQIAMMALGLKAGDEVITASFTYVATAEVIALLGLKPVLVDVLADSFCINPEAVEAAISPKTKAIVPVHLFGQCANLSAIMKIAKKHNLFVIEDTAQAIGASYHMPDGSWRKAGTLGTVGCTSFFPSKNLGCYGDGGALYTNDTTLANTIRMIANHGQRVQYVHDLVGVNSRLDSIQAAILRIKLKHLDEYASARRAAADRYDALFKGHSFFKTPWRDPQSTHVFHQYTLTLAEGADRDGLRKHLQDQGIPAMVYYPIPLHLQEAYKDSRYTEGMFPITESLCKRVISLPMHTELTEEMQRFIASAVLSYFQS